MNLVLAEEHIKLIGVQDDLITIDFQDDVGFTTQNLFSGFNPSDIAVPFVDGSAQAYPKPEEVVFYLLAYHVPYDSGETTTVLGDLLITNRTSEEVLVAVTEADIADVAFDYGTVMNNFSVTSEKDGWIKIKMFALDVDGVSQDVYYETTTGNIIRASDSAILSVEEASNEDYTQVVEINRLKTAILDNQIAKVQSKYTKDKIRGNCVDEDAWAKHIQFLQVGRTSAKIQFDSYGNTWNAAFIIEGLERYIAKENLDEL